MTGVHLPVWILPLRRSALLKLHSVSNATILFLFMGPKSMIHDPSLTWTGLQGQTSAAVINEMKDSLIDHYA